MRSNQTAVKPSRPRNRRGARAEPDVCLSRVVDAPRPRVFAAWTSPEQLMGWWRTRGLTMTFCLVDLRPGGAFLCRMRSLEGLDVWSGGLYHEVVEGERLVFTAYFGEEKDGGPPRGIQVTVSFADEGDRTRVTWREVAGTLREMEAGTYLDRDERSAG